VGLLSEERQEGDKEGDDPGSDDEGALEAKTFSDLLSPDSPATTTGDKPTKKPSASTLLSV